MKPPVAHGLTAQGATVVLRPRRRREIPVGTPTPYDDFGGKEDRVDKLSRSSYLLVDCEGNPVGYVSWHAVHYGPNRGSQAWNIGIHVADTARGLGIGSVAQRLLAEHLLATTDVDRIEASTDVTNIAEQRALERAGFTREGILRQAQERPDGRHDLVSYSFLRADLG